MLTVTKKSSRVSDVLSSAARRLTKWLLEKHKYPPKGIEDAVQTVMSQCEMWTDHISIPA